MARKKKIEKDEIEKEAPLEVASSLVVEEPIKDARASLRSEKIKNFTSKSSRPRKEHHRLFAQTKRRKSESVQKNTSRKILPMVFMVLGLIALSGGAFWIHQKRVSAEKTESPQGALETLRSLMELPSEEPTIATVSDKQKLENQAFFRKAENGDKVFFFQGAQKAVLYRPTTKKIIEVANVAFGDAQPSEKATQQKEEAPKSDDSEAPFSGSVALYNGSTKTGVTYDLERKLKDLYPDANVALKEAAKKDDYQGIIVIDLSGQKAEQAKEVAEKLGGRVETLPEGETAPSADILVIIGNTTEQANTEE